MSAVFNTNDNGNDGKVLCRCNTGSYCRKHKRFRAARSPVYDERGKTSHEHDDSTIFQPCGGGTRIIRKKIGGD